jgi:uncharacterized protein (TIGR02147 family)
VAFPALKLAQELSRPDIFGYDDFRKFIQDWLDYRLSSSHAVSSIRSITSAAGFRSPNYLRLVAQGKRNLTAESIGKISQTFELSAEESRFFRQLVLFNQAKTHESRKIYLDELLSSRSYRNVYPVRSAQLEYYSKWYYVVIREMVSLKDFKEDVAWIANRIVPRISEKDAEEALKKLQRLGLIERDESGKLCVTRRLLTPEGKLGAASLKEFHRNVIRKAADAIDLFPGEEREISSVTVSVDQATAAQMRSLIVEFRKRMLGLVQDVESPEEVFQFNLQFFPMTKKKPEESSE